MPKQCRHIKTNGSKCQAIALRDKPYCYYHMNVHRLMAAARKPSKAKDRDFEFTFPDSPAALQLAVFQVLSALGSSQITLKRAGMILYGLQIAMQSVDRSSISILTNPVHCITQAENGDEFGPDCEASAPGECGTCVKLPHCPVRKEIDAASPDEDPGKPLPPLSEMLRDAIWKSLSGLSDQRFEMIRDSLPKSGGSKCLLPLLKT
jgi:hypothetical protein